MNAAAAADSQGWPTYGGDTAQSRYSPLDQINLETIARLGLAWSLDLPGENSLEATPLEVNGTIYFPGGMSVVYAVDAATGKPLWKYDPKEGARIPAARRMVLPVNRGVAYADNDVLVATKDGRMIAIDAKSGLPKWSTKFLIAGDNASSTGAPRVCGANVIIGNSNGEMGARGYVTALNIKTGKMVWRFFTVPGNPAVDTDETTRLAANTWSGQWWKYGGGGTTWNALTCDPKLGQVLIGTENADPYALELRMKGRQSNLFVDSVVAVDAKTGRLRWYYQFVPGEAWDYKAIEDLITTHLRIAGVEHRVLLQANGDGFFYVIDRTTGKAMLAERYGKENWAYRIDLVSGKPVERPGIWYRHEPFTIYPGELGAHDWQAMSYDPVRHLAFVPYIQMGTRFSNSVKEVREARHPPKKGFADVGVDADPVVDPRDPMDGRGALIAWNVVKGRIQWQVNHPSIWNGGTLVTAGGLVFQGLETGYLAAYSERTGRKVWSFNAKLGIMAPPITFSYRGKQYVSILVGYGGSGGFGPEPLRNEYWPYGQQPRRLLTFSLDGKAHLPYTPPQRPDAAPLDERSLKLDKSEVAVGADLFNSSCAGCHNGPANGTGAAPDLLSSKIAFDPDALRRLLREGYLAEYGMPKFSDLTRGEMAGIYQYIRQTARDALKGQQVSQPHRVR
jgi:quinohemoprotein ethanol dehydrogenase